MNTICFVNYRSHIDSYIHIHTSPPSPLPSADEHAEPYSDNLEVFLGRLGPTRRPAWLAGGEWPGRCDFIRDWQAYRLLFQYRTCCPDRSCPAASWWNSSCCYIVNVQNPPSWTIRHARKEWLCTPVDPCFLCGPHTSLEWGGGGIHPSRMYWPDNLQFYRSQIHERTIALRFLRIILRVLRPEVSVTNVFITNLFQTTFTQRGGGE
jgi:hypothetical protein